MPKLSPTFSTLPVEKERKKLLASIMGCDIVFVRSALEDSGQRGTRNRTGDGDDIPSVGSALPTREIGGPEKSGRRGELAHLDRIAFRDLAGHLGS